MRTEKLATYQILDSGNFRKLEQVGKYRLIRPAAGAVWSPSLPKREWDEVDAIFERFSDGQGKWKNLNSNIESQWQIAIDEIPFSIKKTSFGHLGVFPEQQELWGKVRSLVQAARRTEEKCRVLNLFAYTGGSSMAALLGGAEVVHVDASKTSVSWAKENVSLLKKEDPPIRWILEDVGKFIEKEIRRGSTYNGIILDPPTFGRGTKKEIWKIERDLLPLINKLNELILPKSSFILLSSHSQGYTPLALSNIISQLKGRETGHQSGGEMCISERNGRRMPNGTFSLWSSIEH